MNAILFDFGGTIDTDGVHWSEKYWELYERFWVGVSKTDFERSFVESEKRLNANPEVAQMTFYQTIREQLTIQFGILGLDNRNSVLTSMLDECYGEVSETILRARGLLKQLQTKYRLAVVSNFYGNLELVCKEFDLYRLFDAIVDSAVVGIRKPDPEVFNIALNTLGVVASDSFVVGDSYERDIVPGKQLGCKTIWLKGKSWASPVSTEAADYTVGKLDGIKSILL